MNEKMFEFNEYIEEAQVIYLEDIREGHPKAFTRKRKTTPYTLMLQMFAQKGNTQFSELLNFYSSQGQPLDISTVGFYKARMNYNPNAIKLMMKDYLSMIYENDDASLVKLNGYLVTAIDGSDIILPSTTENAEKYGVHPETGTATPVMAKLSLLYDCINKLVIDPCIGPYKSSERDFASEHLHTLKETLRQPTVTTLDRGYFSMRLIDQMMDSGQKFVMRMDNQKLKRYSSQVASGQDQTFEMTFDRAQTNDYRKDKTFRTKLMNTTYTLRFVKIPLTKSETGEVYDEVLLTNLSADEFSLEGLKELYRLRWEIETAYNVLKNRMKLEEFSGIRERLILQDIYCCIWLYNLTMIHLMEVNEAYEIPQDHYKYEMKRNINIAIGIIKTYFIQSVMSETREARKKSMDQMNTLILKHLVPIRPNRQAKRQNSVNKSRRSYRYTY
ncbi:IS4 family transposase [Oceanobacillus jeddahense]|uniref:IS4 family transposase n=1 Tax=Oceanobacillus jeddahense TaxID=1462527 RepID=A0ABY5K0A3_9BACI|nr:IS4 family transposase [Oceanobacillus jeddahense]UUI01467.1 IS4 family transposase [Oceanobacillus jeddahense]UUI05082.1 IS4 family transposase [Oceanobacillus jeddahense]